MRLGARHSSGSGPWRARQGAARMPNACGWLWGSRGRQRRVPVVALVQLAQHHLGHEARVGQQRAVQRQRLHHLRQQRVEQPHKRQGLRVGALQALHLGQLPRDVVPAARGAGVVGEVGGCRPCWGAAPAAGRRSLQSSTSRAPATQTSAHYKRQPPPHPIPSHPIPSHPIPAARAPGHVEALLAARAARRDDGALQQPLQEARHVVGKARKGGQRVVQRGLHAVVHRVAHELEQQLVQRRALRGWRRRLWLWLW